MRYEYQGPNSFSPNGLIKREMNGVNGTTICSLADVGGSTLRVTYANGANESYAIGVGSRGRVAGRTTGIGISRSFGYDGGGMGFCTVATDGLNRTKRFGRNPYGNLTSITHPDGSVESWTRDSLDLVLTHTDALGRTTTRTRDAQHRVTRIDHPDGTYETFTYNAFGQVLTHRHRNGGTETNVYDATGLKTSHTDPLGNVTTYTYDSASRLATMTDPLGRVTAYEYNDRGLVTKITYADGAFVAYGYDAYGNRTSTTNELGKTWTASYDEFKRVISKTDPLGRITQFSYGIGLSGCGSCHEEAKPTRITLPSGKIATFTYDLVWRKTSQTIGADTPEAATTTYVYDGEGNLTRVTDPRGKSWNYTYDSRDRRLSATDPLGNKTEWTYDAEGNRLTEKRADNGVTTNVYDARNRVVQSTDPKNQVTRFTYDNGDNLITLTDARNNSYGFSYDLLNRKTSMIYPDNSHEDYVYDAGGNMVRYTTRAGQVMSCTFDLRNRETLCDWSDATPDIAKTYDAAGRVTSLSNGVSVLTYTYDVANQLLSETQAITGAGAARTVSYTYDVDGNRASLTNPSGSVITYSYTARNQLGGITADAPPPIASYGYDLAGNRTSKTLENGTGTSYTYDDANRLLSVDHRKGGASFAKFDYSYNSVNNRTSRTETATGAQPETDAYSYDAVDQVTGVGYSSGRNVSYNYDAVGNRTTVNDNGAVTPYTANQLNQYTGIDGLPAPGYNGNGSLTSYNGWIYSYDAQERLIAVSGGPNNVTATFAYDARNRCVTRTIGGVTTHLIYDGWRLIEEYTGTTLSKRYIHGAMIDEIIAVIDTSGTHYHHHDGLGSTVALTDQLGAVVERYKYDVYGAVAIYDGAFAPRTSSALGNRFLFTGREWLAEVNLYDYRNRMYSQELGRFLQVDPIRFTASDVNLYRYVSNNPIQLVDPFGLEAVMRCFRCRENAPEGADPNEMRCYIEEDGEMVGDMFNTNSGPNSTSTTPGDPYGRMGPIPPGTYDIVPRTSSGGTYPPGTPSITDPGRTPGSITTPNGTERSHLYIHGEGRSDGCITCSDPNGIRDIMDRNRNSGGMRLVIEEIDCCWRANATGGQ
jgi:RHS repeat-associated protein